MSNIKSCCSILAATMLWGAVGALPEGVAVKARVIVEGQKRSSQRSGRSSDVVLWLTPAGGWAGSPPRLQNVGLPPQLVQKNKQFEPHVLAVEVGSVVDFPNRDPFFHNVFSLFDGKRFDLGLYEAGSTRSVHFDRAGICYIFCNIHPQMSAIVVVVDTPYFAVSSSEGEVVMPQVPSGQYRLNLWEEHCSAKNLKEAARQVDVGLNGVSLGNIRLEESQELVMVHPNKYGRDYDPEVFSSPIYSQP
jgi:plastocyanin